MRTIKNLRIKAKSLRILQRDEDGVTALEYGLLTGFVGIPLIVAVTNLGGSLRTFLVSVATAVGLITFTP